ncbi:MAG: acetyl-CoA carboxylase biotin carboxylase subunit [Clostridiales bacterium]|nr:acetyl-CoA carboxylase biotin carboxylase subunit [Clostridiales bacterium]
MFHKILIANRGEIAVRIIRACKEMGISTVAVYSQADRDALHASLADESYCIGGNRVSESYLNITAILSVAELTGASAIHPGYGLLAENAKFASLCEKCNIKFIGPSAEVIAKMGDKDQARSIMKKAGIPIVEGSDGVADENEALKIAKKAGFPVLIKARCGGGGKGIRLVEKEEDFKKAFAYATAEAQAAFSDGAVYVEKFLHPVKHIEVQLICDDYNNIVCLGERDCSIQRNNQKIIEESPSIFLDAYTRKKMFDDAINAAKAVGYRGVGTIEFLVDSQGDYYFMEMNTRLQVEHPVTEMVTGIDLVKWQIRVAAGKELAFSQKDINFFGHAIECRINAENPYKNFMPSAGKITLLHIPGGPWVRFDSALYQDYFVPPYYDSMIGKLIVHAATREEAIRKMKASLCELVIEGIDHNKDFLMDILSHPKFEDGTYTTDLVAGGIR